MGAGGRLLEERHKGGVAAAVAQRDVEHRPAARPLALRVEPARARKEEAPVPAGRATVGADRRRISARVSPLLASPCSPLEGRGRMGSRAGSPMEGDGEHAVREAEGLLYAVAVVRVHVHVGHPAELACEPHDGQHRVVHLPSQPPSPLEAAQPGTLRLRVAQQAGRMRGTRT